MRRRSFLRLAAASACAPALSACVPNPGPCPVSLVVHYELPAPAPRRAISTKLILRNPSDRPVWLAYVEPIGRSLAPDGVLELENPLSRREPIALRGLMIPGEEERQKPAAALSVRVESNTALRAFRVPPMSRITQPAYRFDLPYALESIEFFRASTIALETGDGGGGGGGGQELESVLGLQREEALAREEAQLAPGSRLRMALAGRWHVPIHLGLLDVPAPVGKPAGG